MLRFVWIFIGWAMVAATLYLSLLTLQMPKIDINHADKIYHFIAYAGMMIWFSQAYLAHTRWRIAGLLIALGIAIEFIQPYTGRQFDLLDMLANSSGVLIAWWLSLKGGDILSPYFNKSESRHHDATLQR